MFFVWIFFCQIFVTNFTLRWRATDERIHRRTVQNDEKCSEKVPWVDLPELDILNTCRQALFNTGLVNEKLTTMHGVDLGNIDDDDKYRIDGQKWAFFYLDAVYRDFETFTLGSWAPRTHLWPKNWVTLKKLLVVCIHLALCQGEAFGSSSTWLHGKPDQVNEQDIALLRKEFGKSSWSRNYIYD